MLNINDIGKYIHFLFGMVFGFRSDLHTLYYYTHAHINPRPLTYPKIIIYVYSVWFDLIIINYVYGPVPFQ